MAGGNGRSGRRDRREALRIGLGLVVLVVLLGVAALLAGPVLQAIFYESLEPGLGVKAAFAWGFGLTFAVFIVFAVVAGDGVIGELPIMLGAFLAFWVIFSLTIAWMF